MRRERPSPLTCLAISIRPAIGSYCGSERAVRVFTRPDMPSARRSGLASGGCARGAAADAAERLGARPRRRYDCRLDCGLKRVRRQSASRRRRLLLREGRVDRMRKNWTRFSSSSPFSLRRGHTSDPRLRTWVTMHIATSPVLLRRGRIGRRRNNQAGSSSISPILLRRGHPREPLSGHRGQSASRRRRFLPSPTSPEGRTNRPVARSSSGEGTAIPDLLPACWIRRASGRDPSGTHRRSTPAGASR